MGIDSERRVAIAALPMRQAAYILYISSVLGGRMRRFAWPLVIFQPAPCQNAMHRRYLGLLVLFARLFSRLAVAQGPQSDKTYLTNGTWTVVSYQLDGRDGDRN